MEICHHATRRSAPLRSGLTARLAPAPLGGLRPPAARSAARASRRPPGASGWLGGSAHALPGLGPPLAARLGARKPRLPRPAAVFGPLGRLAALFALSAPGARPAAAVPCVAAVAPARGPRRGFAAPVRRLAPSGFALPGAGPPLLAPRSGARPLVRAVALRGLSLPPSAFGPALASLRASCPVALAVLGLGPCAARRPWGARCGPAVAASGPAAPRPPPARPFGPLSSPRGRALAARRAPAPGLLPPAGVPPAGAVLGPRCFGCARSVAFRVDAVLAAALHVPCGRALPCAPPPRRPRWGLRGA